MKSEHKEMMKARRRNIKLTLSYDGTNYHGFQRQTKVVAVQNVLEGTLFKLFGDSIELAAAGRTDAGVHAIGQVVNFFYGWNYSYSKCSACRKSLVAR